MRSMLFVVGHALGHVGRSVLIARRVRESEPGIEILFAHPSSPHVDRLVQPVFESIPIPFAERGDERFADGLERVIADTNPALICLDLSPAPWLYLVRFPPIPRAYVTNFFLTSLIDEHTLQVAHLAQHRDSWNPRRRTRGLPDLVGRTQLYDADAILLADPCWLVPEVELPAHFTVVGPCVWQPDGALPAELSPAGRVLLVSLGSTGNHSLPIETLENLRSSLRCDVAAWVSGTVASRDSGGHSWIRQFSGVALDPILERSPLAVTQGGAGSTYAALSAGVPVAVWPSHRNHEIMTDVVVRVGVGAAAAELGSLPPGDIRCHVAALQDRCRDLRATGTRDGSGAAAEKLLSML